MSQKSNDNLYLWDKEVNLRVLFEYLTTMHKSNIKLDEDAIEKLQKAGFTNPIDLANFCFKSGWNEAISVLLKTIAQRYEEIDGKDKIKIE